MRVHLHVEVSGRPVLVVGAGRAGAEKAHRLADAGALVKVIDPSPIIQELAAVAEVHQRPFRDDDVDGAWLVIAAADTDEVNDAVEAAAVSAGAWVNRADFPDGGAVAFGALVRRGRVEAGVTTGGASPTLARWVRDRIEAALPAQLSELAEMLARRPRVQGRRDHRAVDIDGALEALANGDDTTARRLLIVTD